MRDAELGANELHSFRKAGILEFMKHKAKALTVISLAVVLVASACGNQSPTAENPTQVNIAKTETNGQLDSGVRVAIPQPPTTTEAPLIIIEVPPTTTTEAPPPTTTAPPPPTTTIIEVPPTTTTEAPPPPTTTTAPPPTTTTPTTIPPLTAITDPRCNEVEIYSPSLAQRGIKGTNGRLLIHRNMEPNAKNNFAAHSWLHWQPTKYISDVWYPEITGAHYGDGEEIVKFQGSAPGCIPVCFWTDNNNNSVAEAGEFYFNHNTHPTPGIGPAPHHLGRLLRTSTLLFLSSLGYPRQELPLGLLANHAWRSLEEQSRLNLSPEVAGVRVDANTQSCVAYAASGQIIPAPQATPVPYLLKDQSYHWLPFNETPNGQYGSCHADLPGCQMYTYTSEYGYERNIVITQGLQNFGSGYICSDEIFFATFTGNGSVADHCSIFPYIHER